MVWYKPFTIISHYKFVAFWDSMILKERDVIMSFCIPHYTATLRTQKISCLMSHTALKIQRIVNYFIFMGFFETFAFFHDTTLTIFNLFSIFTSIWIFIWYQYLLLDWKSYLVSESLLTLTTLLYWSRVSCFHSYS